MKLVSLAKAEIVMAKDGVEGRKLYDSAEAVVLHLELAPLASLAPHVTPVDMEFFVLEGRGLFQLGEEKREAGPGDLVPSPRGVPHGITNPASSALRVLAIKNPRP